MYGQVQRSTVNQIKATTMLLVGSATPKFPCGFFMNPCSWQQYCNQEPHHVLLSQADSLSTLA